MKSHKNIEIYWVYILDDTVLLTCKFCTNWCRFNLIPIKISARFFVKISKLILKPIWKCKETRIVKTILKKKKMLEDLYYEFQTYYKVTLIKIMWYGHHERQREEWKKTVQIQTHSQLLYHKGVQATQWRKDCLINMWCQKNWVFRYKKTPQMYLNPNLVLSIRTYSK